MSDEFLRVAKKEISDDITEIGILLQKCSDDDALCKNAAHIEKHIHKIKGLAPMMGNNQIGDAAAIIDGFLKTILANGSVKGICLAAKKSHEFMQSAINGANPNFDLFRAEIEKITSDS